MGIDCWAGRHWGRGKFSVGSPLTSRARDTELVANTAEAILEELGLMGPQYCQGRKVDTPVNLY